MTQGLRKNLFFIIAIILVCLPSLIYLVSRAVRPESWDNWDFGSAQTMLTIRYWVLDGMLKHKLLFLPSGYHPEIDILDRPEFRFLADGIKTGGLVGQRLYYTHYPAGYAVPHGWLAKLGVDSRFGFRLLAIGFSFGSLVFLAGFLYWLTDRNRWLTLVAVFYYVTSTTFLGYADSLANMPVDDFLKYGILFFSVYIWKAVSNQRIVKRLRWLMWFLYFLLSISSYDSTFFIFVWLVGFHWLMTRRLAIKEYLFWATAPITGFLVQMLQNVWYLGWRGMGLDFWGSFLARSDQAPAAVGAWPVIIKNFAASLSTLGYFTDLRARWALLVLLILFYLAWRSGASGRQRFWPIFILGAAGSIYGLVFPVAGTFGYQGRQMAPALLLLFGLAVWLAIRHWLDGQRWRSVILVAVLTLIWIFHFSGTLAYVRHWPNNVRSRERIEYLEYLKSLTDQRTMILTTADVIPDGSNQFFDQFYVDRLILSFFDRNVLFRNAEQIQRLIPTKTTFLLLVNPQDYSAAKQWSSNKDYVTNILISL